MLSRTMTIKLFSTLLLAMIIKGEEYDYEHQAKWYDQYAECSMQRQSPIELNSEEAIIPHDMSPISFQLYNMPYTLPAKCENNGHTINIQLPKPIGYVGSLWQIYDKLRPHIRGGPLPPTELYVAESVHFHWGSQDSHGSEHVIDSQRFAMEMHIVHKNSKYSTVEVAREHPDGLAVVGVLYSVETAQHADFTGLNPVITALEAVAKFNESSEITNLTLSTLFSSVDASEYFTYAGSLTSPPCSQAVTWFVFSDVIKISHEQMNRFHILSDSHNLVMENNYRSLQAKGGRKVYLRKLMSTTSGASRSRLGI